MQANSIFQNIKCTVCQKSSFLGSASFGQLLDQYDNIKQVVFGHTHRRFEDKLIHGTRYSCRPFGYYYEWQLTREFVRENHLIDSYHPMKLRTLLRKHDPEFNRYRNEHLYEEFAKAMTTISY